MDEKEIVVNEELTNPDAPKAEPAKAVPEEIAPSAPGSKTDSELLLKSLQEERDKRKNSEEKIKNLEEELDNLKSSILPDTDVYSEEGKALQAKISSVEAKLVSMEEERNLERIFSIYPILKENADDFNEYRKAEYPKTKIESVAKIYLAEKGLLETDQRKGLEKTTGGTRGPAPVGMTIEDVENLRKTNYKKYKQLLMEGKLDNIK
jgi:hypothetical protein